MLTYDEAIQRIAEMLDQKCRDLAFGGANDTRVFSDEHAKTLGIVFGISWRTAQRAIDAARRTR